MANKKDLAEVIATEQDIPVSQATLWVDAVLGGIVSVLSEEAANEPSGAKKVRGSLKIAGFGTFEVRHKEARNFRNPQTGENIEKSEHNVIAFKEGKLITESVNE
ncbi:DNA-binding protein HU-beta [compost metagenome]